MNVIGWVESQKKWSQPMPGASIAARTRAPAAISLSTNEPSAAVTVRYEAINSGLRLKESSEPELPIRLIMSGVISAPCDRPAVLVGHAAAGFADGARR